jgi:DNA (cytosine-5)-methyltransferase 1
VPLTIGSLFSGIGGLELGLEWAGLGPVKWQVEIDPFCRRVLAKHWPEVKRFDDIRTVGREQLGSVDLICGGFPCQDVSSAGKRAGLAGARSGLWFEYARIVGELQPRWVVVENVASGARLWVDRVRTDLGGLGYETLPIPLGAVDVGAPHLRRRIFIVGRLAAADADTQGEHARAEHAEVEGAPEPSADADLLLLRKQPGRSGGAHGAGAKEPGADGTGRGHHSDTHRLISDEGKNGRDPSGVETGRSLLRGHRGWGSEPPLPRVDDGFPRRVDACKALGNAVVPQCAEVVGWVIRELCGI